MSSASTKSWAITPVTSQSDDIRLPESVIGAKARIRAARKTFEDLAASGQEWDQGTRTSTTATILVLSVSGHTGNESFH